MASPHRDGVSEGESAAHTGATGGSLATSPFGRPSLELARALVRDSADMIFVLDGAGKLAYENPAAARFLALPLGEDFEGAMLERVHPDDRAFMQRRMHQIATHSREQGVTRLRVQDSVGQWRIIESVSTDYTDDPAIRGVVVTGRDITEQAKRDRELNETVSLLDALQLTAPVGFCFVDRDFRYVRVNEKAAAINGVPIDEHIGRKMAEVIPRFWPQLEPGFRRVLETGEPVLNLDVTNVAADDDTRPHTWLNSFYPVRSGQELIGVGSVFVDVTDVRESEETQRELTAQLRHQALHDSLTDLPNRALILDRANQMLARSRRDRFATAALFVDLDDFKDINDSLGHFAGDQVLVEVARRLKSALRDSDTVGRPGGDEFVVLTQEVGAHDDDQSRYAAVSVAERILDVFREPFVLENPAAEYEVKASVGIAFGQRPSAEELLRDADVALYQAKAAGKNRYVLFAPEMHHQLEAHLALRRDQPGSRA